MSSTYIPGQSVIDLGSYGKLINPVQVDGGRWYYYWDRSGDGSSADAGGLNGGVDHMTMDQLAPIFNKDLYLASNPAGNQVDFRYHYASLNGVKLSLPLHGEPSVNTTISSLDWFGYRSATSIGSATAGVGSSVTNTSYDDLLAVWDAYNGISTVSGTGISGVPPLWREGAYWSSTPWYDGYVSVHLGGSHAGYLGPYNRPWNAMVALEVLPSDEPDWEAVLQLSFDTSLPQGVTSGGNARILSTQGATGQGAIYFDGDGDSLTVTTPKLSKVGDFLISFRMKSEGAQDPYSVLLSAGSGSWPGNWVNYLEVSNNPTGSYVWVKSGAVNPTQNLNDGNWHTLVIKRQAGLVSATVDGMALESFYVGQTEIDLSTLLVGRWKANQLTDNNFRGYIDDLNIYMPSDSPKSFQGHYYSVSTDALSWASSRSNAENLSYRGLKGYLATVTSAEENAFLVQLNQSSPVSTNHLWLGGSDASLEGTWKWISGPEANTVFFLAGDNAVAADKYKNWNSDLQPNVWSPNEDYLVFYSSHHTDPYGTSGSWTDSPEYTAVGSTAESGVRQFFVEYGGLPATYTITASATSVNEGSSVTFTIDTTNVEWGKTVSYTLTGISQSDLSSGSLTGTATVNQNGVDGRATVTVNLAGDQSTEVAEMLYLTVGTTTSVPVTVLDTSLPSAVRTVWLQKSIAGNQLVVDVIVNQGVSAYGVDFELDVPTGLTLEASSSNFSNTNGWTVLAAHSANRVSFIASAVDDSSGSALGVTSQDLVARLVFTMAPSASTAIVASEASYTLRIPTTAGAAYYETVPIASMPINAAPTGGLTLTPPSEKSSATLAAAAVESAHVFWGYWYTPGASNWANWTAPSITLNDSISGSTPLWIEATGSRSGMFNTTNDTRGDDTNAAGVRFDENNPNYLVTVTYDQLNLTDGTMLGNSAPYGATLIGNPDLGWKPLFNPQGNGLGTVRQNEDFVSAKVTLNDLFGQTLSSGTKLFLAYADDDNGNPGTYNVSIFESLPGYRQGSTLEVSTSTLADADGLGSFSYKWQSSSDGATWATIGGATTVALTLSQAEVGKYIRAQISYTDGGGTQEVITSSASTTRVANVNDPPTGQVTINGTAQQNATLTVSNTLADLDGIPDPGQSGALSYQWFADGVAINGATATTFSLDQSHVGKAISVRASYIDSYGAAETSNSAPTAPVQNVNDPVQGAVLINGTPARGQTLTASNTLTDVDGIPTAGQSGALTYQWFANTSPIVDAIASSFTLTEAQVGKTITVKVSYTDLGGTAESVTSAATPAVYNVNRAPAFSNLGGSVVFTKGGTAVLIDSNATVSDPDAPANFDQATLSISRQGGANAQDSFGSTGYLGALSEGGSLTYDGATVGTVTQNSGGSLKLTFNSAATASVVNRVMQHLTYANSSAIPDHRAPLTWTFNDGNIGAQGMGGSAEAVGQVVVENVRTLSVSTTFWKSGAPLSGVDLTLVGVGLNGADDGKLIAKGVALVGSNLSFDLWTESTSTTSIAGYDVDAVTPASWSTAFEENVRTGWTVVQAQDAVTRVLALSAMSSGAANDLTLPAKLGSVDYTLPSGGNATEIIYTQWGVSTRNAGSITASPMSDLYRSIAQAESADGQATINSLVPDAYNVVASAPLTTNRYITSADALSALKIAVGLSPNPGSTPVTVAQFAAADVDRSGAVNSADALNVLKMAVALSTAPAKSWIWFTDSAARTIVNTTSASVSDWMKDVVAPADSQTLALVGVLRGDVDGSWTPPPTG